MVGAFDLIFDFHMHVFPDALAPKVIPMLAQRSNLVAVTDGTFDGTVEKLGQWGIDGGVFLNIATLPRQQKTINNTAAAMNGKKGFYVFGSVHPDAPDAVEELRRIKDSGIKGIKLHPDYQDFFADDEKVFPIYETCASLGLIVVMHAGVDIGLPAPVHASSDRIARVADAFPSLRIVAAHFGGFMSWDTVDFFLLGKKNIWLDTSMTSGYLDPQRMREMALRHGTDRVLFASDCPWCSGKTSLRQIEDMRLCPSDKDKVLSLNALELLGE